MAKPKIAIDIDGVLADMHTPCFKRLGLNLSSEDVKRWDFFDDLGIDRQQFWETYKKIWSQEYQLIPLIEEDAPTTITKLREKFEVHIVTSRPKETYSGTILWLKYRGITYDKIILLPPLTDKTEHITDYLFLVDDNPNLRSNKVILYDRPWNRGVSGVRRIRSLRKLLEIVDAIAESPPQRG